MDTLVLVLTDVQGSTRLWQDEPEAMDAAMRRHHAILHAAVAEHDGWRPVDQGEGDAVFAAFRSGTAAAAAVVDVQRRLAAEPWPTREPLTVRIGVHVGDVTERDGNLHGDAVSRCARLRGLAVGGQTLLSAPFYELVRDRLPDGAAVRDLGEHRMRDLTRPEHVYQLDIDELPADFPELRSLDRARHNLPVQPSPFVGRKDEVAAVMRLLETDRLVTVTGFGGMGKTRLALQVAAELAHGDGDGVWLVDLSQLVDCDEVPAAIAAAVGIPESGDGPAEAVLRGLADKWLLLVLDNLEQVIGCADFLGELHARCPGVSLLGTSREPLRLRAEREFALPPLSCPPPGQTWAAEIDRLAAYESVRLFVDRAVSASRAFAVTNETAPAVAAICARLDGHPLAIELAAARLKILSPDALLTRLDSALTLLTGGGRDHPLRHQTLQATIAWSYDLLPAEEKALLNRLSVFAGPVTLEAIEAVCSPPDVDWDAPLDVLDDVAALVDKSLLRAADVDGERRFSLLGSIRDFAAGRLAAAGGPGGIRDRHAAHFLPRGHVVNEFDTRHEDAAVAQIQGDLPEFRAAFTHLVDQQAALLEFPWTYLEHLTRQGQLTQCIDMATIIRARHPETSAAKQVVTHQLAWSLRASGQLAEAQALWEELLHDAEELDDPVHVIFAMAQALHSCEEAPAVLALAARLEAATEQLDADGLTERYNDVAGHAYMALTISLRYLDPARSLACAQRAMRIATAYSGPHVVAMTSARVAASLLQAGDVTAARQQRDLLDLEQSGALGPARWPGMLALAAEVDLRSGDITAAQETARRAASAAEAIGQVSPPAIVIGLDVGHVRGHPTEVYDDALRALPTLPPQDIRAHGMVRWRAARAARQLGRLEEAGRLLLLAEDDLRGREVTSLPELLALAVEQARVHGTPHDVEVALRAALTRLPETALPPGLAV